MKKTIGVSIPEELIKKITELAAQLGMSRSTYITTLIVEAVSGKTSDPEK